MERLEVLKWLQKSYFLIGIVFNFLTSCKTDVLWFLWVRIYILAFLHVAASSHICCLEFLCGTNRRSVLYCMYKAKGRWCEDPTSWVQSLCAWFLVQVSRGQSKDSPQSFSQNTFYRSCVRFFHLLESPHHTGFSVMHFIEIMNSEQKENNDEVVGWWINFDLHPSGKICRSKTKTSAWENCYWARTIKVWFSCRIPKDISFLIPESQ